MHKKLNHLAFMPPIDFVILISYEYNHTCLFNDRLAIQFFQEINQLFINFPRIRMLRTGIFIKFHKVGRKRFGKLWPLIIRYSSTKAN
jgi:hypothetical protein